MPKALKDETYSQRWYRDVTTGNPAQVLYQHSMNGPVNKLPDMNNESRIRKLASRVPSGRILRRGAWLKLVEELMNPLAKDGNADEDRTPLMAALKMGNKLLDDHPYHIVSKWEGEHTYPSDSESTGEEEWEAIYCETEKEIKKRERWTAIHHSVRTSVVSFPDIDAGWSAVRIGAGAHFKEERPDNSWQMVPKDIPGGE